MINSKLNISPLCVCARTLQFFTILVYPRSLLPPISSAPLLEKFHDISQVFLVVFLCYPIQNGQASSLITMKKSNDKIPM